MARLLGFATDDGVRLNICRVLRGADAADFRQQLLTSTTHDPNPSVRQEAAASLRPMASDPVVKQTLAQALKTERNSGVRHELELTLLAGRSH